MKQAPVGIIGYGELGRQLELLSHACGWKGDYFFFDDGCRERGEANAYAFRDYRREAFRHLRFLVGIGYKNLQLRRAIFAELAEMGCQVPALLHPTAYVHPSAQLGAGVYVYPQCNVDKNVVLERGVLLNNSAVVSHDSRVGEASFLSPGSILSGYCTVEACVFLGAGTVVANEVVIGEGATVGIGTVVTGNLDSGGCYIGNPVRQVKHIGL